MASSGGTTGTPITTGQVGVFGPVEPPVRTLLPLSRYAEIMGISLPHFWQMAGEQAPLTGGCDEVWDIDNRIDLALTIEQAEKMIAEELGFWPAPKYITDEEIMMQTTGVRNDWQNAPLKNKWKLLQCMGTELLTLKQADASVFYVDLDGDPFDRKETAQIGIGLYEDFGACANECELAVFIRVADGAKDVADPRWEIRPRKIDIDGSTMHITAESSLFLKPTLQGVTKANSAGSDDTTAWQYSFDTDNLVTHVDVYCRTTYNNLPVTLYSDGICDCPGACQHRTQTACGLIQNTRANSFLPRPATWNGSTNVLASALHSSVPMKVKTNYLSGHPLDNQCRMDSRFERAIVKLTNSLLPEPPCNFCDMALRRWTEDREDVDPLTPEAAELPWGLYTKGSLEAWRIVKKLAYGRGG
jgi:hypothetical protein